MRPRVTAQLRAQHHPASLGKTAHVGFPNSRQEAKQSLCPVLASLITALDVKS